MLSHKKIWAAIDALAVRKGLTPSGLARRAGLDPTTFNPSKRIAADGRPRWPSTESLSKILEATGEPFHVFVAMMKEDLAGGEHGGGRASPGKSLPVATLQDIQKITDAFDASGAPSGPIWDQIAFPDTENKQVFAIEISDDSFAPSFRDGDVLIIAPGLAIRRGDKIAVRRASGELELTSLHRQTSSRVEFNSLADAETRYSLERSEIDWMARIIWASQ